MRRRPSDHMVVLMKERTKSVRAEKRVLCSSHFELLQSGVGRGGKGSVWRNEGRAHFRAHPSLRYSLGCRKSDPIASTPLLTLEGTIIASLFACIHSRRLRHAASVVEGARPLVGERANCRSKAQAVDRSSFIAQYIPARPKARSSLGKYPERRKPDHWFSRE